MSRVAARKGICKSPTATATRRPAEKGGDGVDAQPTSMAMAGYGSDAPRAISMTRRARTPRVGDTKAARESSSILRREALLRGELCIRRRCDDG